MSLRIIRPGVLALIQDAGRLGQHHLGMTTGGPLDPLAMRWANRLVHNPTTSSVIEITGGGLEFEATADLTIAVTGAELPLRRGDQPLPLWQSHHLRAGDSIAFGTCQQGLRSYLALAGGLILTPQFGSTATVVREAIGGTDGRPLQAGQHLSVGASEHRRCLRTPKLARPDYRRCAEQPLRLVIGYQWAEFSPADRARFLSDTYQVTERCDRMGYRLHGTPLRAGSQTMLSEGICHGALQIPGDGQPIVLLADRQTIGGYPKLGSVLSLDCARLAQCAPGSAVHFTAIDMQTAHQILHLARYRELSMKPEVVH